MSYAPWIPIAVTGTTGQVGNTATVKPARFGGFTLRNTAASATQVDFYDGTSAAGNFLGTVDLTAKGTVGACYTVMYDDVGLLFEKGVWAVFSQAGVQGSVFLK